MFSCYMIGQVYYFFVSFQVDPCHQYLIPQYLSQNKNIMFEVSRIIDDVFKKTRFIELKKV